MKYSYPLWLKIAFICVFVLGIVMKSPISLPIIILIFIQISEAYVKIENEKLYIRKAGIQSFFEINMADITESKEEDDNIIIKTMEKEYKIKRINLSSKGYEEIKSILLKNKMKEN